MQNINKVFPTGLYGLYGELHYYGPTDLGYHLYCQNNVYKLNVKYIDWNMGIAKYVTLLK